MRRLLTTRVCIVKSSSSAVSCILLPGLAFPGLPATFSNTPSSAERLMLRPSCLILAALTALVACSDPTSTQPIQGQWGGHDASLVLSEATGALAYACGAGTVDSGWMLDRQGRFQGTGLHYFGGGPLPDTGRPPHPAAYRGLLQGNTLTLTVLLLDSPDTLGPFVMRRGGRVVSELCL